MKLPSSPFIQPLSVADHQFMQVLIDDFDLKSFPNGTRCLSLELRDDLVTIWNRVGRRLFYKAVEKNPSDARRARDRLRCVLDPKCEHGSAPGRYPVPFRFANGGSLPIAYFRGKEYYCLFYREIFPIGWNLANGGSDNRYELLDPREVIERELREELVIFNPQECYRYAFQGDTDKPSDWPEFAHARRSIERMYPDIQFSKMGVVPLPHKWIHGRDKLIIRATGGHPLHVDNCYLTVTAEDFGIEIDRVIRFRLGTDDVMVDAETLEVGPLNPTSVVNAPIGLFEVGRLNRELCDDKTEFLPDLYFANGKLQEQDDAKWYVEDVFFPDIKTHLDEDAVRLFWEADKRRFDLCPVTRSLISRYREDLNQASVSGNGETPPSDSDDVEAFISCGGEDRTDGERVAKRLRDRGRRVFFYIWDNRTGLWAPHIDRAIDSPSCQRMIVVTSARDNVLRPAVEYEYYAFHQKILTGWKPKEGLMTLVRGFDGDQLPAPLSNYRYFTLEQLDDMLDGLHL